MAWDLWFEGRGVDSDEFEAWFLERAVEPWWRNYVQGARILADTMAGSFGFFELLDDVEARFPNICYEADYRNVFDISGCLECDYSVSYRNGERDVVDNADLEIAALAPALASDELRGFVKAAGVGTRSFLDEETKRPIFILDEFGVSEPEGLAEGLKCYMAEYVGEDEYDPAIDELPPLETLMVWWVFDRGSEVIEEVGEPYASEMKRLADRFGFSG